MNAEKTYGAHEVLITQKTIVPDGEPIFSERAIVVTIKDDAGGEFVEIRSLEDEAPDNKIAVDASDWHVIKDVVDDMIARCRI